MGSKNWELVLCNIVKRFKEFIFDIEILVYLEVVEFVIIFKLVKYKKNVIDIVEFILDVIF